MNWLNHNWLPLLSRCTLLLLLSGCAPGKHAFLIVQTCLRDERGVAMFMEELRSIATAENMTFIDNSESTAEQLEDVGHTGSQRTAGSRVINIGVQRSDGVGVTAGNLGLLGFEVALGFSEGSDAEFAHAFADRVVARLQNYWQIEVVPAGTGAKSKGGCP